MSALLGIAESSVKRHADAGRLESLQSERGSRRRFLREHVTQFLRSSCGVLDFQAAHTAGDGDALLAALIDRVDSPVALEAVLDELASRKLLDGLVEPLLPRLPALLVEAHRLKRIAVVCGPHGAELPRALLRCVLTARGYQVLVPAESLPPEQLPNWIRGLRAQVVAFCGGGEPWTSVAGVTAVELNGTSVFLAGAEQPKAPLRGFSSMRALGAAVL